ncbi:hypothetical protein [Plantactinospora sp. CA-290183]|uniref:hypothetical protein n=1 Tax=Plantactinospora sp. CA-290183 TaxID=3240006 RepID=UPI003D900305
MNKRSTPVSARDQVGYFESDYRLDGAGLSGMVAEAPEWQALIGSGLGQLTRPFGTAPVEPTLGARALARTQAEIVAPTVGHDRRLTAEPVLH